jgi:hypothetical protein
VAVPRRRSTSVDLLGSCDASDRISAGAQQRRPGIDETSTDSWCRSVSRCLIQPLSIHQRNDYVLNWRVVGYCGAGER